MLLAVLKTKKLIQAITKRSIFFEFLRKFHMVPIDKFFILLVSITSLLTTYPAKLTELPCKTVKIQYGCFFACNNLRI